MLPLMLSTSAKEITHEPGHEEVAVITGASQGIGEALVATVPGDITERGQVLDGLVREYRKTAKRARNARSEPPMNEFWHGPSGWLAYSGYPQCGRRRACAILNL